MSTISASTTTTTAYKVTADTTGALVLQTGATPTTALTIDSSQVVTFAKQPAGTFAGTGPTFSYYQSGSQSISTATATKLTFTSSEFDTTSGMYASSRFTPTVAGYYQINGAVRLAGSPGTGESLISIYKNGAIWKRAWNLSGTIFAASFYQMSVSALVYCNGSTDYIELYAQQGSGISLNTQTGSDITYFQAAMVRSA